jgi:hypothetical protein
MNVKWLVWAATAAAAAIAAAVLVFVGHPYSASPIAAAPPGATAPEPDGSATAQSPAEKDGTLQIWVPTGAEGVDGNYWVYVNGRIVDAPPHPDVHVDTAILTRRTETTGWLFEYDFPNISYVLETHDWEFSNIAHKETGSQGVVYNVEALDTYADLYIRPGLGDTRHLFELVELKRPPGEYAVEVAYVAQRPDAPPFLISPKHTLAVRPGATVRIFLGLPDSWDNLPIAVAAVHTDVCENWTGAPLRGGEPDVQTLIAEMRAYQADPIVQALQSLDASVFASPGGVTLLNLAPALGGAREFDRTQIGFMAGRVVARYPIPSHVLVAACSAKYPDFPESYQKYDQLLSSFEDELQTFHALAQ